MKVQASPAKWWVLKGSLRDGAYASKLVAMSYKGKGELVPMWSIATAKEFIGKKWVPIYNETVAKGDEPATRFFTPSHVGLPTQEAIDRSSAGSTLVPAFAS